MKFTKHIATFAALAAVAGAGVTATAFARDDGRIKSDKMIGVPLNLTGPAGNIRGLNGAGAAWAIGESEISVKSSGKVEVEFEDLVFASGPNTGKNTVGTMRVVVSCLDGALQPVNVASEPFPVTVANGADPGGDAEVETKVDLPSPCFAPIVFVTNPGGIGWFAVDGL
jgi:hypothetical protein